MRERESETEAKLLQRTMPADIPDDVKKQLPLSLRIKLHGRALG